MEFNLSYDYRSSRWLAVSVTKVESALTVSKEQFSGQILIKAEPQEKFKVGVQPLFYFIIRYHNAIDAWTMEANTFMGKPSKMSGWNRHLCLYLWEISQYQCVFDTTPHVQNECVLLIATQMIHS